MKISSFLAGICQGRMKYLRYDLRVRSTLELLLNLTDQEVEHLRFTLLEISHLVINNKTISEIGHLVTDNKTISKIGHQVTNNKTISEIFHLVTDNKTILFFS